MNGLTNIYEKIKPFVCVPAHNDKQQGQKREKPSKILQGNLVQQIFDLRHGNSFALSVVLLGKESKIFLMLVRNNKYDFYPYI